MWHMKLTSHWTKTVEEYFHLSPISGRLNITYNLYDVGCLQFYRGFYCVWCKYTNGLFSLNDAKSDKLQGFVLIVNKEIIQFFGIHKNALDWLNQPLFYLDLDFI